MPNDDPGELALSARSPDPGRQLLGEARQVLTPEAVATGRLDADEAPQQELRLWLGHWGVGACQVERGEIVVLRVGRCASDAPDCVRWSYVPVRTDFAVQPGRIVEFWLSGRGPMSIALVRADNLAAGDCEFRELPAGVSGEEQLERGFGHPKLLSTLYCARIETEGFQRQRSFWFHRPEAQPAGTGRKL